MRNKKGGPNCEWFARADSRESPVPLSKIPILQRKIGSQKKSARFYSFCLLTLEIGFALSCLRWKIGLVFFTYGSPFNKLKTTPTPNKNGSYGIKGGGSYAIFLGSVCHIFCRNPLNLTDFYAIRTSIVWHILGAYFLQIWGVGVVRIIFTGPIRNLVLVFFTHGSPTASKKDEP